MNTVLWLFAGSIIGWLAFSVLGFNAARGMIVSIVIGAAGAMLGGKLVAPVFIGVPGVEGVSVAALVFAAVTAAMCLAIGNMVYRRWGV